MAEPFALGMDLGASNVTTLAYHRRFGVLVRTRIPSRVSEGPASTCRGNSVMSAAKATRFGYIMRAAQLYRLLIRARDQFT